jgi:UDP-glucuronate decarboxylase
VAGDDITIYGDGGQTRSFQHVDDLIDGAIRMMENTTGLAGPLNRGNSSEFTILALARKVLDMAIAYFGGELAQGLL